jgi:hypothetical protein
MGAGFCVLCLLRSFVVIGERFERGEIWKLSKVVSMDVEVGVLTLIKCIASALRIGA